MAAAASSGQSVVDASLQKGELSYFHAFKDTREWEYEAEAPQLLAAGEDELQREADRLLALEGAEAEAALAQAASLEVLRRVGDAWLRRGSLVLAEAALSRALQAAQAAGAPCSEARRAELHARRSEARRRAGELAGALEDAERCIGLRKDWSEGHFQRGNVLVEQGKFLEADQAFAKAAALEASSASKAPIAQARAAIADRLPWGEDVSPEGDGSALLRVVKRGDGGRAFAEDLCTVRCHCRLHEQSDAPRQLGDREFGRLRWSSYSGQQGVDQEYNWEDEKKEPLEWVLGEDAPPFPLLDAAVRKLRGGGEAKVRLQGVGSLAEKLPVPGKCDAIVYLISVAPPCQGPSDEDEWCGVESVNEEVRRGFELLDRAAEALHGERPAKEVAHLARAAERRCSRACAWLEEAEQELRREAAGLAEDLRLRALCGRARALLWRREALLAESAGRGGSAASAVCASLSAAMRGGSAPSAVSADVERAAASAARAVELSGRKSADALHVHGLALIASGDLPAGQAALEEALLLEPGPAATAVRDSLVRLRSLDREANQADAGGSAADARERLEAAAAAGDAGAVEQALRELLDLLGALPYETVMSLKLGKVAAVVQKAPPSETSRSLAVEFIAGLRKLAMSQGRR